MNKLLFNLSKADVSDYFDIPQADFIVHKFPDGETYIRVLSEIKGKEAVIFCPLDNPDEKILSLLLLCAHLRENKAEKITLVASYLAYMRQDIAFNPGEVVSSGYFAKLLSNYFDELITVDPHLHRIHKLEEIYTIPCRIIHAAPFIAGWIKENIQNPVLIGPDEESKQWVAEVAEAIPAPFTVLTKKRFGDRKVEVSLPENETKIYRDHTPVLVDDIISTAMTMIEAVKYIREQKLKKPYCIGVHAIFAGNAFEELKAAGVEDIVTCNTIIHPSNQINVLAGIFNK